MHFRKTIRALLQADAIDAGIDADEHVVFFPTAADLAPARPAPRWRIPVHGWIYQPTEFTYLRRAGLWLIKQFISRQARQDSRGMAFLRQRAGMFLADNERWHRIFIRLGHAVFQLNRSTPNGHFRGHLELSSDQLALPDSGATSASSAGAWVSFNALTRPADKRVFDGRALLLPPEGLSVISDIDDTIKVTQVSQRRSMLANTFLKEFASVPEMAALYQRWALAGAAFHYVSASPWHLYPFLAEFLHGQGFPEGTFHLRDFRLMPSDLHRTLRPSRGIKLRHSRALLERFPKRRFLLVGDSGESDPAIYAQLFREFPRQIEKICIRNVTGDPPDSARWTKIFRLVSPSHWQIFTDPEELLYGGRWRRP
jgi:hypothetical protein